MYLDLHGMTENEAILEIDAALWELSEGKYDQIEIITGNGIVLKDLVIDEVTKQNFRWEHPPHNFGSIIVYRH